MSEAMATPEQKATRLYSTNCGFTDSFQWPSRLRPGLGECFGRKLSYFSLLLVPRHLIEYIAERSPRRQARYRRRQLGEISRHVTNTLANLRVETHTWPDSMRSYEKAKPCRNVAYRWRRIAVYLGDKLLRPLTA